MAENEEVEGTPAGEGEVLDNTAAGSDESESSSEEVFLGRWKTKEDAEKGITEQDRKITQQAETVKGLEARLADISERESLAQAVKELAASNKTGEDKGRSEQEFDEYFQEIGEKHGVDPEALKAVAKLNYSWVSESSKQNTAKLEALQKQLSDQLAEIREEQQKLAPDYLEAQEEIDRIRKDYSLTLAQAKKLYQKEIRALKSPSTPGRLKPPSSVSNSRVADGSDNTKPYLSKDDRARLKEQEGLDEEDLDRMEADYQKAVRSAGGRA